MKRSTTRVLTTHAGSLPRPNDLIEMLRAKDTGQPYDKGALMERVRTGVVEIVRNQANAGVDVVNDGELGKPSFSSYVRSRLNGMDGWNSQTRPFTQDTEYPGYQSWQANRAGSTTGLPPGRRECIGPLSWKDKTELHGDIDNLKAALKAVKAEEGFLPSASVGIIAQRIDNKYYSSYEDYVHAIANVMKEEYQAITRAGLVLQIDAPEMAMDRIRPEFQDRPLAEFRKVAELWVEALNHALTGIPEEQVRFHICWGNSEGPHSKDVPLKDVVDIMLKVKAAAYSVEAANPRHGHEWKVWRDVKLPEGKVLIPGTIDSTTNFVEHPELVADRVMHYATIVGRERVIASTDCGFATLAFRYNPVYPPIVWGKLKSMAEGAALASTELWKR